MSLPVLPPRRPDSHKGDYGTVLVVAGSRGMMGAAVLAATAALRSGAGLAILVVPDTLVPVAMTMQVCATVRGVGDTGLGAFSAGSAEEILAIKGDVAVIGPGIGNSPSTMMALQELVQRVEIPFVLDADGLNAFAGNRETLRQCRAPHVLTPHVGEMARLSGKTAAAIQAAREASAAEEAKATGGILVLKGHRTVVTDGTLTWINETGNPGMATAGSGDVLAGVIGALIGQGLSAWDASRLGVYVHGLAGDHAAAEKGQLSLISSDLLDTLPLAFRSLEKK